MQTVPRLMARIVVLSPPREKSRGTNESSAKNNRKQGETSLMDLDMAFI